MPPEHIVARLAQHGQSHVLAHWDTLSSDQQQSLILQVSFRKHTRPSGKQNVHAGISHSSVTISRPLRTSSTLLLQIDSIDYSRLLTSLKSSLAADAALQSPASRRALLPASNVAARAARTPEASSAWRSLGLDLLRDGKCAVVLLAGGQGTRLGSSAPKGCYDIGLPSRKSLFELHADRMRTVQALAGPTARPLRWYIMTSDATDRETKAFFEQHAFFGLRREQVVFFPQGTMPALTPEGKLILATPGEIAMAPDGNGGLYRSLVRRTFRITSYASLVLCFFARGSLCGLFVQLRRLRTKAQGLNGNTLAIKSRAGGIGRPGRYGGARGCLCGLRSRG